MKTFKKESDLFPPLKKYFNELGYKVFTEVPYYSRSVDFVATKGDDHIAVEMKLHFNKEVIYQAGQNIMTFGKSYVAYPVKKGTIYENNEVYWKLRESVRDKYENCRMRGIGILQILPHGTIFTTLEAKYQKPYRVFDFSTFEESVDDEAGLPCQKGVSSAFVVLDRIEKYVTEHPEANWKEIYENVQNHYSSKASLSGSMSGWKGFNLEAFKRTLS